VSDLRGVGARAVLPRLIPVVLLLLAAAPARAADCEALARQMKLGVLDQRWGGVLEDATKLVECDPKGPHAEKAAFYRARALDRLRRLDQALGAYREFLNQRCAGLRDSFLCEDATVSMYSLAADMVSKGKPEKVMILLDGLQTGEPYSRIFAAIRIAKLPANDDAKEKALPVLIEAYRLEDDADFRNEICLGIIRIDPAKCGGGPGGPSPGQEPQWIKVRVFDCKNDVEKVKVNLPFSFAEAAIESLGPEILKAIQEEGVFDLQNFWASIRKLGPGEVFRLEINEPTHCEEIEIWFE
jgi:tetratricopeptide (TPR) repeat protein